MRLDLLQALRPKPYACTAPKLPNLRRLDRSALLPFALSSRGCLAAVQHCLQALQEASGLEGQLVYLNNKAAPTQALKSVSVCVLPTPRLQALFANPCITPADLRSAWEALAKQTAAGATATQQAVSCSVRGTCF